MCDAQVTIDPSKQYQQKKVMGVADVAYLALQIIADRFARPGR